MVDAFGAPNVLRDHGFTTVESGVYGVLLREPGVSEEELARLVADGVESVRSAVRRLAELGLVTLASGRPEAVQPNAWVADLVAAEVDRLGEAKARLSLGRDLLPHGRTEPGSPDHASAAPMLEVVPAGDPVQLFAAMARGVPGELLWLRPDQWRYDFGARVDEAVIAMLREGGSSRAIYPARVLEDAPEVVHARAEAGERVRLVASLPTQLGIKGTGVAAMSALTGLATGQRVVVRHEAVIRLLRLYFEQLWERGVPLPGLDDAGLDEQAGRRLLLQGLSSGAKDEQIARALGLSLRTVRRRVAHLIDDLGADSRFQAGVEAARRGWV